MLAIKFDMVKNCLVLHSFEPKGTVKFWFDTLGMSETPNQKCETPPSLKDPKR